MLASLALWFYLTQQSRYIIALIFPSAFLFGGCAARLPFARLASGVGLLQAAYTLFWFAGIYTNFIPGTASEITDAMRFAIRGASDSRYLSDSVYGKPRFPFWEATERINDLARENLNMKVALFDEVRGFYLDAKYFWANPGFSTLIDWETAKSPEQLVAELQRLGATHVYLNFDPAVIGGAEQSFELRSVFFPEYFQTNLTLDHVESFRKLIAEAYRHGLLEKIAEFDKPASKPNEPDLPPKAILLAIKRR
jgi:hypothetical protein